MAQTASRWPLLRQPGDHRIHTVRRRLRQRNPAKFVEQRPQLVEPGTGDGIRSERVLQFPGFAWRGFAVEDRVHQLLEFGSVHVSVHSQVGQELTQALPRLVKPGFHGLLVKAENLPDLLVAAFGKVP